MIKIRRKDEPIIKSLLDIDFYKITMGNLIYLLHPKVKVKFAFRNRTKGVRLADHIDIGKLREEFDHARTLTMSKTELHYIRGTYEYGEKMFDDEYILKFLANLKLPEYHLSRSDTDGNFKLEFEGEWAEVTYWETIALSIITELYFRSLTDNLTNLEKDAVIATGVTRLLEKIRKLKKFPEATITDFGTRRRASTEWQEYVVVQMTKELGGQFRGTSNTRIAMDQGLLPMGTFAHELDMAYSGIYHESDDDIRESHLKVLEDWWNIYDDALSIALTDTYGSEFFFKKWRPEEAAKWKGTRQDSGDPFEYGEKTIQFYKSLGVDPKEKIIIFSDSLDENLIIHLHKHFKGRIKTSFGWGTKLTNDLGFKTLSLVIKLVESNGHGAVKLSDNLAKAVGKPADVERFKKIFGHTVDTYKECET